jgi:hypothetical protein
MNKINSIEENISSLGSSDSYETSNTTTRESGEINASNLVPNAVKMSVDSFLGENNRKPDLKNIYNNDDPNDLLTLQIKYAINKISSQYYDKNNTAMFPSPLCDYFCNYHLINNNNDFSLSQSNSNNKNINNNLEKKNRKNNNNNHFTLYYNKFSNYIFQNYK